MWFGYGSDETVAIARMGWPDGQGSLTPAPYLSTPGMCPRVLEWSCAGDGELAALSRREFRTRCVPQVDGVWWLRPQYLPRLPELLRIRQRLNLQRIRPARQRVRGSKRLQPVLAVRRPLRHLQPL